MAIKQRTFGIPSDGIPYEGRHKSSELSKLRVYLLYLRFFHVCFLGNVNFLHTNV